MDDPIEKIKSKQEEIYRWLKENEISKELPLYSSVDVRDAGFKAAVVDTNLFPAGFNNLCEHGIEDAIKYIRQAVLERVPGCENILIVAEEYTRNTWYLENIRVLQDIIEKAGFHVLTATFLTIQPGFCQEGIRYVELTTATGASIKIHCFKLILKEIKDGLKSFELIILNNDLTTGIPDVLKDSNIPIYPSIQAGWHSRHKSQHFKHTADLVLEFAKILQVDSWLFSCLDTVVDQIDINRDKDRQLMMDSAADLFKRIQAKYDEHHIKEKPYIVLKSDSGTYGMSVVMIEDPKEIADLNRRSRNRLNKGKSSQLNTRFLLQEGVPTIYNFDNQVSEVVIYQIANNLVGGFYRMNADKSSRENLNSQGMTFKKMCPHLSKYGDCSAHHDLTTFDVYRILSRIAGIAAQREVIQLEIDKK